MSNELKPFRFLVLPKEGLKVNSLYPPFFINEPPFDEEKHNALVLAYNAAQIRAREIESRIRDNKSK